jgi:16S rRNA (cytosine967-C5)-methyltransferase
VPVTAGRGAALRALAAVRRGRRLDLAFAEVANRLDPRERAWTQELVYGTIRFRGRLDHLLDHHLRSGMGSVEPSVADILRLGAYQLLRMESVPPYAAVSQAVDQARAISGRPGIEKLVNAVLRSVGRSGEDPERFPSFEDDPSGYLSTWGSHPRWLVERWLARWPRDEIRALVEADNQVPRTVIVPLDGRSEAAAEALAAAGIDTSAAGDATALELPAGTLPAEALAAVPRSVIQDPAASLVGIYADVTPGSVVVDLCAAPGGKALLLAGRGARVLAVDRSAPRLSLLRNNAERAGVALGIVRADAAEPPFRPVSSVLVDAPCTGTGTLRRHPDARWRLDPKDIDAMAAVQRRILDGAARVVAQGGSLIYGTCSLEWEENEAQVDAFLERHAEFRRAGPGPVDPRYLDGRGQLVVLPWRAGFDGAFAARLVRSA